MPPSLETTCKRCGKCCLVNVSAFLTDDDRARWQREGRDDILQSLDGDPIGWGGDHMVQTGDGAYTTRCPFLEQTGDLFACAIYDTRPFICSNFTPGSSDLCPQYDFGSHPVVKQQISRDH